MSTLLPEQHFIQAGKFYTNDDNELILVLDVNNGCETEFCKQHCLIYFFPIVSIRECRKLPHSLPVDKFLEAFPTRIDLRIDFV